MILQCKNCNARYLVPDQAIGAGGRTVRCARCSHSWFEGPPTTPIEELPDFDKMIGEVNATAKPIPPGSNLPAPVASVGWGFKSMVAVFAIMAIALGLFITMPGLFGAHPSRGLVLADLKVNHQKDEESNIIEISGNIMNEGEEPHLVPNIRVMLLDGENNPLRSWEFSSNGETLPSKSTMPFTTKELDVKYSLAKKLVVDLGTPIELALRRKPK